MTTNKPRAKAIETTTARTGSQIGASIVAGAAVGSVILVGGTAVGLGVGLVMSIDTGDGKTVGDRIADAGEAMWNWIKGVFGG